MINKMVFVAVSFLWCSVVAGQTPVVNPVKGTTVELPKLPMKKVTTVVSVPDGGKTHLDARRNRMSQTSHELLARARLPAYLQSHICAKVTGEGKTVYDIVHKYKPLTIVIHDDGKIEITIVRHYDETNRDDLESDHPEIAMHINAIPSTSPGNGRVQLSLDIDTTVTVDDVEELKTDHPGLHGIYQQYAL